jgi:hypothetical protein
MPREHVIYLIITAIVCMVSLAFLCLFLGISYQKQKQQRLLCPWTKCKHNKACVCTKRGVVMLRDYGDDHAPLLSCASIETEKKPATKPTKTINFIV